MPTVDPPSPRRRALRGALALAAAVAATPSVAHAQRAEYARPDELRSEVPYLLDVSLRLGYTRVLEVGHAAPLAHTGTFSLRTRALVGRTVAWCGGLDGEVGGADAGFVYGLTGYLLGGALRWGRSNGVCLTGGAGFSGAGDAVPFAGRFPAELSVVQQLGPVRVQLWAHAAWVLGDDRRSNGSQTLSFADEAEAGLSVRIGKQRQYWSTTNAGAGPSLGVVYREFMGARSVGLVLGLDLTGAR